MHRAKMLRRHNSVSLSGAGSKYRKKYCELYARKLIKMQTDGIASCDNRNGELAMLVAHHISESIHWQHAMNDREGDRMLSMLTSHVVRLTQLTCSAAVLCVEILLHPFFIRIDHPEQSIASYTPSRLSCIIYILKLFIGILRQGHSND